MTTQVRARGPIGRWLYGGPSSHTGEEAVGDSPGAAGEQSHHWAKVMCLTGVDYFSTLGYQPGIAALAAGTLAPIATIVLVLLTLFGALPVYRRVAHESPHGQGSIAMLQRLLPFWRGKFFVLALLGFAATSWIVTITLSSADAAAHAVENPHLSGLLEGKQLYVTLFFIIALGALFLKGFNEAIGVAVALVVVYLGLNFVVIGVGLQKLAAHPGVFADWKDALFEAHGNPLMMLAVSMLLFPKLALGMSGFETGVAVMSHVKGEPTDTHERPTGRVRNTGKLLTAAAWIMSFYLITSAFVTTLLIPAKEFEAGGAANGRALAYVAHLWLGDGFGTVYDASTIAILWFAGASAMAGLLNLIPRYLPRFGMAPEWSSAVRPLVLVLTLASVIVTVIFDADVDKQGGAYATGVLVLFTSAAIAVSIAAHRAGQRWRTVAFVLVTVVLLYTTGNNVIERPDGVKIAAVFIAMIVGVSLLSRILRAFELRVTDVQLDERAQTYIEDLSRRRIRLIANEPDAGDVAEYRNKVEQIMKDNDLADSSDLLFVEVTLTDPSDFESTIEANGLVVHKKYRVLRMKSPSVPNALAALALHVRDVTGVQPHLYFEWTEGDPMSNLARFLLFGAGEVAPVTREVLRRAEPDRRLRPHVHVG